MKKIVLITGGTSELGQAIIREFTSANYKVYAPTSSKLDVQQDESCKMFISKILKKDGRIDILINCAGYSRSGPTTDFSSSDFLKIIDTNVVGAFRLIKEVVPSMKKRKLGRIVNITSLSGLVALPNFGIYSASKFALEALGLSLRYELEKCNIWVTNIAPGAIKSEVIDSKPLRHRPFREKFRLLDFLMPMVTTDKIAKVALKVSEAKRPRASMVLGSDAKIVYALYRFLPRFFWDKLQFFVWNSK